MNLTYQRLGKTGLRVSKVSLGLQARGKQGSLQALCPEGISELVQSAFDSGVNLFFDQGRGTNGEKSVLVQALDALPTDEYHLCAKLCVSNDPAGYDLITEDELQHRLDSLAQCYDRDEIDVLLIELWPAGDSYEKFRDQLYPVLQKARYDGKIRYIGGVELAQYDGSHSWLAQGLRDDLFDAVMVAYNIINQSAEREVFRLCSRNHTGVIGVYASGRVFSQSQRLHETIQALKTSTVVDPNALKDENPLDWLLDENFKTVSAAAYQFVAGQKDIHTVMTGTGNIQHLKENIEAVCGAPLPKEHRQRLREIFGELVMPVGN